MLTPSIAGALMGLSSVGVMANSLTLRLKLDSKQRSTYKVPQETKHQSIADVVLDVSDSMEKTQSAKWRST